MKSSTFISGISKQLKSKNEETQNLEKGITKELLDKYKPKVQYNIENFSKKKEQRRAA